MSEYRYCLNLIIYSSTYVHISIYKKKELWHNANEVLAGLVVSEFVWYSCT